jgi:catechol 2,3-dioxygenase-like lactoylglutathione lyase family enzyme
MKDFNFVILYVQDATASADFYARLLGGPPVEASPGFAMFVTPSGVSSGCGRATPSRRRSRP